MTVGAGELDDDSYSTICDCCSAEIDSSEAHTGETGSEWEGSTLCPICFTNEGKANGHQS